MAQGVAIGLVALLFILLAWSLLHDEGGDLSKKANAGELPSAPDFTLERLDQEGEIKLSSLHGKAVVLNVWASWCIPCKDEAPYLEEVWQKNHARGLVVLGLDAKDFRGDAKDFLARYGVTYSNVYDGKGSTVGRYGVTGFPETYFVDADGKVRYRIAGPVEDAADLDAGIERALAPA